MKRGHQKKKKVLEANYLTGNIPCLAIATINLHPKGAFLPMSLFVIFLYCASRHATTPPAIQLWGYPHCLISSFSFVIFKRIGKYILSCRLGKCERSEHFLEGIILNINLLLQAGVDMSWSTTLWSIAGDVYKIRLLPTTWTNIR